MSTLAPNGMEKLIQPLAQPLIHGLAYVDHPFVDDLDLTRLSTGTSNHVDTG
jgi:hypothetical protein